MVIILGVVCRLPAGVPSPHRQTASFLQQRPWAVVMNMRELTSAERAPQSYGN